MLGTLREWRGYCEALWFSLSEQQRKKACFVSVRLRVEDGGKKMLPRRRDFLLYFCDAAWLFAKLNSLA